MSFDTHKELPRHLYLHGLYVHIHAHKDLNLAMYILFFGQETAQISKIIFALHLSSVSLQNARTLCVFNVIISLLSIIICILAYCDMWTCTAQDVFPLASDFEKDYSGLLGAFIGVNGWPEATVLSECAASSP